MLADSPSHYLREPEIMDFLSGVPTVWDETHALRARIGDYVAMARRQASTWHLGAMSDEDARTLEVELSFPEDDRTYRMTNWADGPNADRYAEDFQKRTRTVSAGDTVRIEMAPGGGFAARIEQASERVGERH